MQQWNVRVEWAGQLADDQYEALSEQLDAPHGGRVGPEENGNTSAFLHVEARTIRQAFDTAVRAVEAACKREGLPCTVVGVELMTWEEFERRQAKPPIPPLVGPTEIAQRLGVTRQRAWAIIQANPDAFPEVASTSRGALYLEASLDRFEKTWERKSGRPRKNPA